MSRVEWTGNLLVEHPDRGRTTDPQLDRTDREED